ncbi:aminomethyl-transferring glycine dehydrogenase subunit GcvPB [Thermomicrobiaceae bacterium CFH 74404]|uniref:Probable glycine dehydrogenase (decarboxylating) subunit 2 n=1 Tax=Thermalbibacter longus TaxID=2951981 RepID=A0AA41WBC5_9BACT|nr:aminomethyl-transferring glycine dehydrogenase subunit GcvPB [Thermalbibacter longus]MCM8749869.1 aminomethyl-transferring glycine dehydrogenase subunit GcvPB [Thermalbibacter longus]
MRVEPLIFELSKPGRHGVSVPDLDVPEAPVPDELIREELPLPEVSEIDVIRHFTRLSQLNHAVDIDMYPLGSCTMKYNPKINEVVARLPGFAQIHPLQDPRTVQGALELMYRLQCYLAEIAGFDAVTLQPAAGAHGELTGILIARAYFDSIGDHRRTTVLIPDSAHGTNPATAAMAGFKVVEVKSDKRGNVDIDELRRLAGPDTAALMITNPNTLGLWDEHIDEIVEIIHGVGGLVYNDGANFNAILGIARPGDLGVDIMHFNLHKTFSTPHGGGGPGSGPVGVKAHLARFLPGPVVARNEGGDPEYTWAWPEASIGKIHSFHGNFGMHVRAYTYIRMHGSEGLRQVSEDAVLAANYLLARLRQAYDLPYDRTCMHEFVLSATRQKQRGVRAMDIAKRLLDFGFHPPTVYFPLIVPEALMIEPTETESIETLDAFATAMLQIADEVEREPEHVQHAPHRTFYKRLDEVRANRELNLRWDPQQSAPLPAAAD